jgi:cytochrome c
MKKTALILATLLLVPAAFADTKATYDAKCKMCHGTDGKKNAKADFSKAEDVLVKHLLNDAKHKTKVADEAAAKALVTYIKTLK